MKSLFASLLLLFSTFACATDTYFVSDPTYLTPQDAINDAQSHGGGLVRFPCGLTTLSSPLTVTSPGVTLQGCGLGGTVLSANFAMGDVITFGNLTTPFSPCGGVRDMTITTGVTRSAGYAIAIAGCGNGLIENIQIDEKTNGGNGIHFSDSAGHLAVLITVTSSYINLNNGPFTAIQIDNGNDRFFSKLWLQGGFGSGSRGIDIKGGSADWFKDIEVVNFQNAVMLEPIAGNFVKYSNFDNVLADTNTLYGFYYAGAGGIDGISCIRCWASTNGYDPANGTVDVLNGRGFRILNGSGLSFVDSRVFNKWRTRYGI